MVSINPYEKEVDLNSGAMPVFRRSSNPWAKLSHPPIIVIDGASATGKTSLARELAEHFGVPFLDSGAWFRVLARIAIEEELSVEDPAQMEKLAKSVKFKLPSTLSPDSIGFTFIDSGTLRIDRTYELHELQTDQISQGASKLSKLPVVRKNFVQQQRELLKDGGVTCGRAQGTEVFGRDFEEDTERPILRFYVYTDEKVAAERRYEQLKAEGANIPYEQLLSQLQERNTRDMSRKVAPLLSLEKARKQGYRIVENNIVSWDGLVAKIIGISNKFLVEEKKD